MFPSSPSSPAYLPAPHSNFFPRERDWRYPRKLSWLLLTPYAMTILKGFHSSQPPCRTILQKAFLLNVEWAIQQWQLKELNLSWLDQKSFHQQPYSNHFLPPGPPLITSFTSWTCKIVVRLLWAMIPGSNSSALLPAKLVVIPTMFMITTAVISPFTKIW